MNTKFLSVLLTGVALAPASGWAQASGGTAAPTQSGGAGSVPTGPGAQSTGPGAQTVDPIAGDPQTTEEAVEVSTPGGAAVQEDIVVTGTRRPNIQQRSAEVVSILSTADIARTGEGDIAGALNRVTGLSVVGNGFVYVRGLGDRYSSSLLNGSPLPSPEPLRRVVPLDIFPTTVTASALVQKTYSVNYPAEFGGGVINLTTRAVPTDTFLQVGGSVSADTVTTSELGYVYDGGDYDWTGYDDGTRDVPGQVRAAGLSGANLQAGDILNLDNAKTSLLLQNNQLPANFSYEATLGTSVDIGATRVGVIAAGGLSNGWRTRSIRQQVANDANGNLQEDFQNVLTDNRVIVNGLFGLGVEFGDQRIRWTNLYIHDTLKQGGLARGALANSNQGIVDPLVGTAPFIDQANRWFERELIDTQLVGEFRFGDISFDARGSYAKTRRDSPYERAFRYEFDESANDYVNRLGNAQSFATVAFSELEEELVSGQANLTWDVPFETDFKLSAGYFYSDTTRASSRFDFRFRSRNAAALPSPFNQLRPDFLLSDFNIQTNGIFLANESSQQGAAAYDASLRIHAGYAQVDGDITEGLRAQVGVRYETADQEVLPLGTFLPTRLGNDYWLPAVTVTWNIAPEMQIRGHLSKTIARPQFRELAPQVYQDFESDRVFFGNPTLTDSELYNAEVRYEYFFGRDQRFGLSGFYKRIDNPIETVAFFAGEELRTGFANAPEATLYGGEAELQKYVPLDGFGEFFATRRAVIIANYTYTKSDITADDTLVAGPFQGGGTVTLNPASSLFPDGAPLTGQSEHLVNLQLGIEDTERLSQLTLLFNYASNRATNRGPVRDAVRLPDFIERPGIRLDVVARQGIRLPGIDKQVDFKLEARNLTGTGYREFQRFENGTVFLNRYRLGRAFSLGASITF
jgi:hypothetical protein